MAVPFLALEKQYAAVREEVLAAIGQVLDSQTCVLGPQQKRLEASVSRYCRCRAGIACSSGTDALLAILMALGVGDGDEVICPAFTFFATAAGPARVGAKPVFVDVDPETFNMDPAGAESAVTARTKAIIPVYLYGQLAEMETICRIAADAGITVIEDAAQAIGATRHGKPAGAWGRATALSFYPTKNLNAMGDAGMVVTDDAELAQVIRTVTVHGDTGGFHHVRMGGNFRMDEIQAAALNVKLKYLDSWHESRRGHARIYDEMLAGLEGVRTPVVAEGNVMTYNLYVIRADRRDDLMAHLRGRQIGCAVYYPMGLHEQPCFGDLGYRRGQFPVTEQACREVLALPVCPELTDGQIAEVAEAVRSFYG
jgi:dTDP-4-amino-4,6-dideoxygalactose transaminase